MKASPEAPGVCEFQSNAGPAISSAISISGLSQTASPVSERLVPGGTNTIRVGTSVAPISPPSVSDTGTRRVVRQAVPNSAPRQPQQPMLRQPHRFQPALDAQGEQVNAAHTLSAAPYASPRPPAQVRGPARSPYGQRQMAPSSEARSANRQSMMHPGGRPPIGQPIGAPQPEIIQTNTPRPSTTMNMPRSSAQQPVTWQNAQQFQPAPSPRPTPPTAEAQPQPTPSQGGGLYGRLNDDMPTVASAPTLPVTQSPLAGGPSR